MAAAKSRKNRIGGKLPKPPRETIRIWLDRDVIGRFRFTGSGWQSRINEVLKRAKVS
jgi:uncharacterized protein (DUF4415 family)